MKFNPFYILLFSIILIISCNDDSADLSSETETHIYIKEIQSIENNILFIDLSKEQTNKQISITLGVDKDASISIDDFSVNLRVDSDILSDYIKGLSQDDEEYLLYKNAKLLADKYFSLPSKIHYSSQSDLKTIDIDVCNLLANEKESLNKGVLVLPIRIDNPTKYSLNKDKSFMMIVLSIDEIVVETFPQIYIHEAQKSWNGSSCDYHLNIYKSSLPDTTFNISFGLSDIKEQNQKVKFEVVVDVDSLDEAISLSHNGPIRYKKYAKSKSLPSKYYSLPTYAEITEGNDYSTIDVKIDKLALLKDYHTKQEGNTFVLPIRIINSTHYNISPKEDFVMFFLHFPDNFIDPTKPDPNAPMDIDGYNLIWHDEFNNNGKVDATKWSFERGFVRNQELQWYQESNVECENGSLVITGKKERVKNPYYQHGSGDWKKNREYAEYTSASITASKSCVFKYGKVLVRAKIPTQRGAWPAIWTVGNWWEWPLGGEIDILEYYLIGGTPSILANLCWGSNKRWSGTWASSSRPFSEFLNQDPKWVDKYHIWKMDWDENFIRIYLDDKLLNEVDLKKTVNGNGGADHLEGRYQNPFSNNFGGFGQYLILNLALGGNGGTPDNNAFPMKYYVDYVRVYQKE